MTGRPDPLTGVVAGEVRPILTFDQGERVVAALADEIGRRRLLAQTATPGPWERGPYRHSSCVVAPLPEGEREQWIGGVVPEDLELPYAGQRERCVVVNVPTWSSHRFVRSRSGRDLDHIAVAADPTFALRVLADAEDRAQADLIGLREAWSQDRQDGPHARRYSDSLRRLSSTYNVEVPA